MEGVLDQGRSQVALRMQAAKVPASDSCPDSVGAVERIIPPQIRWGGGALLGDSWTMVWIMGVGAVTRGGEGGVDVIGCVGGSIGEGEVPSCGGG